ncbi:MAG: DUF1850 domain-containing protein [Desulfobacteraceae bacterium]|jgi:hypothetical protein|nr:DUF1850 domain-containing protein [Desulfobacteraceae bacterium]
MALALAAVLVGSWPLHALVISHHRAGQPVFARLVAPGETFSLGFVHSVEHCPVSDRIRIDDRYAMMVVETAFTTSRTGLPHAAVGQEVYHREADRFRITNMHRPVPEIFQWVDHRYHNTLQFDGAPPIPLASLAGDALLHIRIQKLPALALGWLKAKLYWRHRSENHG